MRFHSKLLLKVITEIIEWSDSDIIRNRSKWAIKSSQQILIKAHRPVLCSKFNKSRISLHYQASLSHTAVVIWLVSQPRFSQTCSHKRGNVPSMPEARLLISLPCRWISISDFCVFHFPFSIQCVPSINPSEVFVDQLCTRTEAELKFPI